MFTAPIPVSSCRRGFSALCFPKLTLLPRPSACWDFTCESPGRLCRLQLSLNAFFLLLLVFFLLFNFLFCLFETGPPIAQVSYSLELRIFLTPPAECWDYRCEPLLRTLEFVFSE